MSRQQAKYWCWTYHHHTEAAKRLMELCLPDSPTPPLDFTITGPSFWICSLERCPETQRLHLQGFFAFEKKVTMGRVQAIMHDKTMHVEKCNGTFDQNAAYCGKAASHVAGPWEEGERPTGKSKSAKDSAYKLVIEEIKAGKTDQEIVEAHPFLLAQERALIFGRRLFDRAAAKQRDVTVIVVWGAPHCGKTTMSKAHFPDYCPISGPYTNVSFANYRGQSTLIFDGFVSGEWPLTVLESIIKPDVVTLNIKGSHILTTWTTVVITTNESPNAMYVGHPNRLAFAERVTKWKRVTRDPETHRGEEIDWDS